MSIASVSSIERSSAPSHSPRTSRDLAHSPRHVQEPRKSSAIPRPSLQSARSTTDTPRVNSPSLPQKRPRTYSQPPSPPFTNNPLPTPESSRPTSPRTSDVKPTRIPVATRTRTTSSSSHAHSIAHRAESRSGSNHRPNQLPTPDTSQDHRVVKSSDPPQPTAPPMASIQHQASSIMNEPPPFPTSFTSPVRSRTQDPLHLDPRPSNDSEERPFEHWYRGDVHRNGGVGEFRVAKHIEMLQIANYGHSIRNTVRGRSRDTSAQIDPTHQRRRADSVDAGTHESLYLDDAPTKGVRMVLDETPLTDIEPDPDTEPETFYDACADTDASVILSALSVVPTPPLLAHRSQIPTSAYPVPDHSATPKHAARTHASSDPLRSSTPSAQLRTSAESTMPTPGPRARTVSRTTSPISQSSDQSSHTKRRAKSPAASSPASTPKKARTKAKTPPSTSRREDPRNSIATYPTPEGDIVNAIPTWTQPVQKSGNWDEVVLPVVARRRGLDGQYEQADGSPKLKLPGSSPVKPAPGTFGYDYGKYRPPRLDEEIQLHEFGRLPECDPLPEEDPLPPPAQTSPRPILRLVEPEESMRKDPRKTVPKPPDSPAPFAHYHINQVPTINVTRPSSEMVDYRQEQQYEDTAGGCCRCVIM